MRIPRPALVVPVAAATLALSACGFGGGDGGEAGEGSTAGGKDGNLVIALQFTPKANFALETDDAFVLTQVGCMETLLTYDFEAGELKPLLATEWKQTSPKEWDFTLRDGVKFQDGTDLTAEAVAEVLTKALKVDAPARAFKPDHVTSVTAVDPKTVRLTTPTESALLPFRLASVNTGILAPKALTGTAVDPIGNCTGPFTATEVTPNQGIKLKRNDAYWGEKAALATVEGRFIPEGATRATQVRTGEAQIGLGIPSTSLADLEGNKDIKVTQAFTPRTSSLYFNTAKAPFDKPEVRKAIVAALDLKGIAENVYGGSAEPAIGPFSPTEAWAPKSQPPTQDVEEAKRLLNEAGYGPGKLTVGLLGYTERTEFADLATVIQDNLSKVGVKVNVKISDYAAIEPALLDGSYDMALLSRNHLTDIADPIGFLEADYTCKGGYNISQYCDPAVDAKIKAANDMKTPEERNAVYAELAQKLQDDAVSAFLVHEQTTAAHRTTVKNFVDDPLARYSVTPQLSVG